MSVNRDLGTHDCPSCGHMHHGTQHRHVIVHGRCDHLLSQCCEKKLGSVTLQQELGILPRVHEGHGLGMGAGEMPQ